MNDTSRRPASRRALPLIPSILEGVEFCSEQDRRGDDDGERARGRPENRRADSIQLFMRLRAPSRESRAFRTGRTVFNLPIIDLVRRDESVVIRRLSVRAPPVLDSRRALSRTGRGLAHMRARTRTRTSSWNPVSDSSATNVMDGHRSRPFSSPTTIGGAGPSNVSRGRSSVETSRRAAA